VIRFIRTQFRLSRQTGFGRGKSMSRAVCSLFTIY
jgi:hypothetical protein